MYFASQHNIGQLDQSPCTPEDNTRNVDSALSQGYQKKANITTHNPHNKSKNQDLSPRWISDQKQLKILSIKEPHESDQTPITPIKSANTTEKQTPKLQFISVKQKTFEIIPNQARLCQGSRASTVRPLNTQSIADNQEYQVRNGISIIQISSPARTRECVNAHQFLMPIPSTPRSTHSVSEKFRKHYVARMKHFQKKNENKKPENNEVTLVQMQRKVMPPGRPLMKSPVKMEHSCEANTSRTNLTTTLKNSIGIQQSKYTSEEVTMALCQEKESELLEMSQQQEKSILKITNKNSFKEVQAVFDKPQKKAAELQDFNQNVMGTQRYENKSVRGGSTIRNWSFINSKVKKKKDSTLTPIEIFTSTPLEISSKTPTAINQLVASASPKDDEEKEVKIQEVAIASKFNSSNESMRSSLEESIKLMENQEKIFFESKQQELKSQINIDLKSGNINIDELLETHEDQDMSNKDQPQNLFKISKIEKNTGISDLTNKKNETPETLIPGNVTQRIFQNTNEFSSFLGKSLNSQRHWEPKLKFKKDTTKHSTLQPLDLLDLKPQKIKIKERCQQRYEKKTYEQKNNTEDVEAPKFMNRRLSQVYKKLKLKGEMPIIDMGSQKTVQNSHLNNLILQYKQKPKFQERQNGYNDFFNYVQKIMPKKKSVKFSEINQIFQINNINTHESYYDDDIDKRAQTTIRSQKHDASPENVMTENMSPASLQNINCFRTTEQLESMYSLPQFTSPKIKILQNVKKNRNKSNNNI